MMKKTAFVAVLTSVVLGGCAMHEQHGAHMADRLHSRPQLTVRYGVLAVAPEPVILRVREAKPIAFQAPAGYTFPRNGIDFLGLVVDRNRNPVPPDPKALKDAGFDVDPEGKKAFACAFDDKNPREIVCSPTGALKPGIYRYAMRVLDKDKKLIESDPHVFAMD